MTQTPQVEDNRAEHRFELDVDGQRSIAAYEIDGDVITFTHTLVPESLQGRGIGSQLVAAGLAAARSHRQAVVPRCEMFAAYMKKHPETQDLLATGVEL